MNDEDLPVWFPPNEIRYYRVQLVFFLFEWLDELRRGCYPVQPSGAYRTWSKRTGWRTIPASSYTERPRRSGRNKQAPFLNAAVIAADIDSRLKLLPPGGERFLLNNYNSDGLDWHQSVRIEAMLRFISGWRNPRVDFLTWRKTKRKHNGYSKT